MGRYESSNFQNHENFRQRNGHPWKDIIADERALENLTYPFWAALIAWKKKNQAVGIKSDEISRAGFSV